jgi:DNA invertase Pin-like site-specific DNA recombinase
MTYGYIRVSTDKQRVDNQRFEIEQFCKFQRIKIDNWIEETISGTKSPEKRRLGMLLKDVKEGDTIICTELSRLGRTLLMIMGIISTCMERKVNIWTIKDNFRLNDDIQSKVLAFAFGLAAEIERNLISQRTKEALARVKAEGKKLGNKGGKYKRVKLTGHEKEIKMMIKEKIPYVEIARRLGVDSETLRKFRKERLNKAKFKREFAATQWRVS